MKIMVIGSGRAATALAPRWRSAGHEVVVRSRRDGPLAEAPGAEVLVLAVPDGVIAEVARALIARPQAANEVWLHLSGVHPAQILRGVLDQREVAAVGCLHPLVALAPGSDPTGAVAGIEGEPEAVIIAEGLARDAGLVPHPIPAERALYHAAAVSVAGHATALFAQAMSLLEAIGMSRDTARRALQPLMASAADNLARGGPERVITGPLSRGDVTTIERHLRALAAHGDDAITATYRLLASTALTLSRGGLDPDTTRRLGALIRESSVDSTGSDQ